VRHCEVDEQESARNIFKTEFISIYQTLAAR
jgi:hypothetical protein